MESTAASIRHRDDVLKMAELIRGIKIGMFVTVGKDGCIRSRPMATQAVEFDGDLWFFTDDDSDRTRAMHADQEVNVVFTDPDHQRYVSVTGAATIIHDHARMADLWRPSFEQWFKQGLADPSLALIKVEVAEAEYWDAPPSLAVRLIGLFSHRDEPASNLGEHGKINLI